MGKIDNLLKKSQELQNEQDKKVYDFDEISKLNIIYGIKTYESEWLRTTFLAWTSPYVYVYTFTFTKNIKITEDNLKDIDYAIVFRGNNNLYLAKFPLHYSPFYITSRSLFFVKISDNYYQLRIDGEADCDGPAVVEAKVFITFKNSRNIGPVIKYVGSGARG